MTDRPIIFSGSMVRALLAGRKTQTRRLASSPLARCVIGDRLYVREAWAPLAACTHNDPDIVALTFTVTAENIDRTAAPSAADPQEAARG